MFSKLLYKQCTIPVKAAKCLVHDLECPNWHCGIKNLALTRMDLHCVCVCVCEYVGVQHITCGSPSPGWHCVWVNALNKRPFRSWSLLFHWLFHLIALKSSSLGEAVHLEPSEMAEENGGICQWVQATHSMLAVDSVFGNVVEGIEKR